MAFSIVDIFCDFSVDMVEDCFMKIVLCYVFVKCSMTVMTYWPLAWRGGHLCPVQQNMRTSMAGSGLHMPGIMAMSVMIAAQELIESQA